MIITTLFSSYLIFPVVATDPLSITTQVPQVNYTTTNSFNSTFSEGMNVLPSAQIDKIPEGNQTDVKKETYNFAPAINTNSATQPPAFLKIEPSEGVVPFNCTVSVEDNGYYNYFSWCYSTEYSMRCDDVGSPERSRTYDFPQRPGSVGWNSRTYGVGIDVFCHGLSKDQFLSGEIIVHENGFDPGCINPGYVFNNNDTDFIIYGRGLDTTTPLRIYLERDYKKYLQAEIINVSATQITGRFRTKDAIAGVYDVFIEDDYQFKQLNCYFSIDNPPDPGPGPGPQLVNFIPSNSSPNVKLNCEVVGSNFESGTLAKVIGQGITIPIQINSYSSSSIIGTLDLHNAPIGLYDIQVTNPDGKSDRKNGSFQVIDDTSLQVISITPNTAPNTSPIRVTIEGEGFQYGDTISLTKQNGNPIFSENNEILPTSISTTFDITNADPGIYTLNISNPDGQTAFLKDAFTVTYPKIPVILVHGWRGSVDTWGALIFSLEHEGIPYVVIDFAPGLKDPRSYAPLIRDAITRYRDDYHYQGKFDIVCHSMGALVSRSYMEGEMDGASNIRQWIGVAPVNHGAAIADLAPGLFSWLNKQFNIQFLGTEPAIKAMKTNSDIVQKLETSQNPNVIYKVLVGINDVNHPDISYNLWMLGRTLEKKDNGKYRFTLLGDGLVAMKQSKLEDNVDIFVGKTHTTLTNDPIVVARIIEHLKNPDTSSWNNIPTDSLPDQNLIPASLKNKGNFVNGYMYSIPIDKSVKEAILLATWESGSGVSIISPNNIIMDEANSNGYSLSDSFQYCDVLNPTQGLWKVQFTGENSDFSSVLLVDSPIQLVSSTQSPENRFPAGNYAQINAHIITNGDSVSTVDSQEYDNIYNDSSGTLTMGAEIQNPDGSSSMIVLYDDGTHGDSGANDGIFGNRILLSKSGQYDVRIIANYSGSDAFERNDFLTLVADPEITDLHNTTFLPDRITWTWTDPSSTDFSRVMVYIDDVFQTNVTKGVQTYTALSLTPDTDYTIATRSVSTTGLINQIWVNDTARTALSSQPPTYTIKLYPGWNFVSTPKKLAAGSNTVEVVFANVDFDHHSSLLYDGQNKTWIQFTSGVVKPLDGIWVYSKYQVDVPLQFDTTSIPIPPSKLVYRGWNAIGETGVNPISARELLTQVGQLNGNWDTLIGINASSHVSETYIRDSTNPYFSDLKLTYPTAGYWLQMNLDDTLEGLL